MNEKALSEQLRAMIATAAWKQVELAQAIQREAIIKNGKNNRKDEKGSKFWAELSGFDKAVSMIYRMADYKKQSGMEEE